jgi:hypothetical protein
MGGSYKATHTRSVSRKSIPDGAGNSRGAHTRTKSTKYESIPMEKKHMRTLSGGHIVETKEIRESKKKENLIPILSKQGSPSKSNPTSAGKALKRRTMSSCDV